MDLGDGRFLIEKVIGEGGTARVYRGKDTRTGQPVAVKVLRESVMDVEEIVSRFQLEADLLARFEHPNIPPMLGRGTLAGGVPWFAEGYAAHGSLADRMLRQGRLPAQDLLGHVVEILDALHYLHQQGVIHRDVKPENVLLDEHDVAMLCDFGISLAPDRRGTMVGDQMGTPSFMAPEQYADPGSVTPAADLFGTGVTLFVGLTGQTGMVLLVDHLRSDALAALPPKVAAIVDRATSLRVENRYKTAWEMSLDVADLIDEG